jgi:hypothetical protein
LDYGEFRCKWIEPRDLWNIADESRNKYWPESILPVNTEEIVEFRLRLDIEPIKFLLSKIDIDAYLRRDLSGIVVDYDCYMEDRFANRMRFSFAHELGHFFCTKIYILDLALSLLKTGKISFLTSPKTNTGILSGRPTNLLAACWCRTQSLRMQWKKQAIFLEKAILLLS